MEAKRRWNRNERGNQNSFQNRRQDQDSEKRSPIYLKNMRLKENISNEERDVLLKEVPLTDGSSGDMVTCYKTQNIWRYTCHICNVNGLEWKAFSIHVRGPKHADILKKPSHSKEKFLIKNDHPKKRSQNSSAICEIQKRLDDCSKPLIGLEYVLEIVPGRSKQIQYFCLLCDKQGNLNAMMNHLPREKHYTQYLRKFFRSASANLDLYGSPQNHELFGQLTEHVVAKIEYVFGRLKPTQVQETEFMNNKKSLLDNIEKGKHLKESSSNNFISCVDISHLNPIKCTVGWRKKDKVFKVPTSSNIKPLMDVAVPNKNSYNNRDNHGNDLHLNRSALTRDFPGRGNDTYDRQPRSNNHSRDSSSFRASADRMKNFQDFLHDYERGDKIEPSPNDPYSRFEEEERRFYEYACSNVDTNLWQNYQNRIQLIETELLDKLRFYQETPENHPKYDEEWKEYYYKRNEQLITMGENPKNYDIKVEWNAMWDIWLKKWFKELFEMEKAQLRQQLQFVHTTNIKTDKIPQHEPTKHLYQSSTLNYRNVSSTSYNTFDATKRRNSSDDDRKESSKQSSHFPVIPVLRQLSVLEHNLGSLGPKVVDLLSKALTLEKSTKNGADEIMLSQENCVLLETVNEKMKGLLHSGLLQETMVNLTEAAINSVCDLLSLAAKKEKTSTTTDRHSHSSMKKPRLDEQRSKFKIHDSHLSERRPHSIERRPRSIERRPHSIERKLYSNEQRSHSNEQRSRFSVRERMPKEESTNFNNKRATRLDERNPYSISRSHIKQETSSSTNRKLYTNQKPGYGGDRYTNDGYTTGSSSKLNNLITSRTLKISEINFFVKNLRILDHLSSIERTGVVQKITAMLHLRGVTDVTEDEVLLLVKTLIPSSVENSFLLQSQRSSTNISGRIQPDRGMVSTHSSLLDISKYPQSNTTLIPNQSAYSFFELNKPFLGAGGNNMMNPLHLSNYSMNTAVTYPLNTNPYKS